MKRFSLFSLLALGVFTAALLLNACQKDAINASQNPVNTDMSGEDRSPTGIIYGVTLYDGVTPCRIIGIDQNTGAIVSNVTASYVDPFNNTIPLDNIKGICLTDLGKNVKAHFLTTGNLANPNLPNFSPYNDALFKVDPKTGTCSYASTSTVNTVSDLEYEPNLVTFYGLRNNSNSLVTITGLPTNFNNYVAVGINGIAAGYTLKGLSLVRDNGGTYLVGCANDGNAANPAKLYRITPGLLSATATYMTDLAPLTDFSAGHCGIGFDLDLNQLSINRSNTFGGLGLNRLAWPNVVFNPAPTGFWTAGGLNFEDLSSSVY